MHAANFGDAGQYKGKHVLVVGLGNSGSDILNHLARIDVAGVWVSVRHGSAVLPKSIAGLPVHLLSPAIELVPAGVQDLMGGLIEKAFYGDLGRLGFPPLRRLSRIIDDGTAPAVDDGFMSAILAGRFVVVPELRELAGWDVVLADGRSIRPQGPDCPETCRHRSLTSRQQHELVTHLGATGHVAPLDGQLASELIDYQQAGFRIS